MLARLVRNLFGLSSGESGKVLGFAALGAFMQAGLALGMACADSMFLVHVGAGQLPIVYLITPVVMLVYIAVFSALMTRWGIDKLFKATLVFLVLGAVAIPYALNFAAETGNADLAKVLFYAAKLYTVLWYIALYTLFWNFVDGYFDILDAKRLYSLLAAGCALGAAAGGGLVTLLIEHFDVQGIFVLWAFFAFACMPMLWVVRKNWKKIEVDDDVDPAGAAGFVAQLRWMFAAFRGSRFAVILASTLFLVMNVTILCEYQYFEVLSKDRTEADLAKLFGVLYFSVNIFNLVVNLFLFNRMVGLLGVRNMALIQPISYLAVFAYLLVDRSPIAGIAGFFAYHGLLTSIDYNNTNFLLNALPAAAKRQLRTFIEGLCEPLASALMGLFLIFVVELLSPEQLSAIGMAASAAALLFVFILRTSYVTAMVGNLKRTWLDFSLPLGELSAKLNAEDLAQLKAQAADFRLGKGALEEQLTALRLLRFHDPAAAVDALLSLFEQSGDTEQPDAEQLLCELLRGQNSDLIQRVLLWLEEQPAPKQAGMISVLARWGLVPGALGRGLLESASPELRAAGCVVTYSGHRVEDHALALAALDELLRGDDRSKKAAIRVLGHLGMERYAHVLVDFLLSDSPDLSRAALETVRELSGPESSRLVDPLLRLLDGTDEPRRLVAMQCLAQIADSGSLARLLAESQLFSPAERRQAERVLLTMGLKAVPACVAVLTDTQQPHAARSIAARALAKLSFVQLESLSLDLIEKEIQDAYRCLVSHSVLERGTELDSPGLRVLARYYNDRRVLAVEFVLELLTLSGRVASFELLSASLRSKNPKQRADAIETLQQACSRSVFRLFGPLLDLRRREERKRIILKMIAAEKLDPKKVLDRAIDSDSWLESAAAAQALADRPGEQVGESLRKLLRENPASPRSAVIVSLLNRGAAEKGRELNIVERIDTLVSCSFFESFSIEELRILAEEAECAQAPDGETIFVPGERALDVFVVREGAVHVGENGSRRPLRAGDVFGEEAVLGAERRVSTAEGRNAAVMRLSGARILDRAAVNARIASGLIGYVLGAGGADEERGGNDAH